MKDNKREYKCKVCGKKAVPTTEEQFVLAGKIVRCKECWKEGKSEKEEPDR